MTKRDEIEKKLSELPDVNGTAFASASITTPDDITESELAAMEARCNAAFKGPWRYHSFEIDCGYDECTIDACRKDPDKHQGYEHDIIEVEAPDEYPDGQCVVQIQVPGLEQFATANGEFIAHARQDLPRLLAVLRQRDAQLAEVVELLETILTMQDGNWDVDDMWRAVRRVRASIGADHGRR